MPYPYLVQIAWDTMNKFILDWQKQPYRWSIEADIHAEIYSRLSNAYELVGHGTIVGNYKWAMKGFEHHQTWNRVSCKYKVDYQYKDGKKYHCFPDVIVWDEVKNPDSPPEPNWPILWLCEIKTNSGKGVSHGNKAWDVEKMEYIINQNYAQYGVWLNLFHRHAKKGNGITWQSLLKKSKLWVCTVELPVNKR